MTKRLPITVLALTITAGVLLGIPPAQALEVGDKATPFRLQAHTGKWYKLSTFKKRILVLWYEGMGSRKQNHWIHEKIRGMRKAGTLKTKNVDNIGIANYQDIPIPNALIDAFIRRNVERNEAPGTIVLRDRNGTMQRLYGMRNGRSNIFVFDAQRRLIWKSSGPLSRKRGKQFLRMLRRITR